MEPLTLTTYRERDWTVVHVSGEIDLETVPGLRSRLLELIATGHLRLILDLDAVEFIDSTGLSLLVTAHKRLGVAEGALRLVCTSDRILRVLRLTGLAGALGVHSSIAAATTARRHPSATATPPRLTAPPHPRSSGRLPP